MRSLQLTFHHLTQDENAPRHPVALRGREAAPGHAQRARKTQSDRTGGASRRERASSNCGPAQVAGAAHPTIGECAGTHVADLRNRYPSPNHRLVRTCRRSASLR
eukprot:7744688-Alexandrium_andersonii.AAC.1